jgi:peptide/nickel transport system permease protein
VTNPTSLAGLLLLFAFIVIAALAPVLAPPPRAGYNPYMIPRDSYINEPQPPSKAHPLGTTSSQYDIYYGLVWGTRTAFRVGLIVTAAAAVIGIVIGSIAAFYGGLVDELMMRVTDIFMTIPFLIAAMVLVTILGQGLDKVMIALIAFGWMGYARLIRSDILSIKELDYVSAARALGAGDARIILRHIIPNAIFPTIITATMSAGSMVITASSLSFLGLGAPLGYADWGQMISFSRHWMLGTQGNPAQYWYTVIYPGAAILLFCLSWNLMGDAFRDILDPRLRGTH